MDAHGEIFRLTISAKDRPGLVARATGELFAMDANIVEAQHFADQLSGLFFMRLVFRSNRSHGELSAGLAALETEGMTLALRAAKDRQRILLLVSKFDHCMVDLLYRARIGELDADIAGIVSNHPRAMLGEGLPDHIPFHHVPVTADTKSRAEAKLREIIARTGSDLIVLARYMQILSDDMARHLAGRCINIHHSFLPGFKGAKPYHQAHARGVKMIGATAHYVTADLDEGPIIHQGVETVTHADSADDMVRKGRDVERRVLARAVRDHLEQRIFIDGRRTIVFND